MMIKQQLVILGAGIGGLSVLKELSDIGVSMTDVEVTIVDEDFSHFLGFTLPWVMRGWREEDSVPIRPDSAALQGINTVTGSVQHDRTIAPYGSRPSRGRPSPLGRVS